jgi:PAS domain S-box-containing protein
VNWLRFSTLSIGSLTTTLLLAVITGYLLSLKVKRPDTWYLAGYLGCLFILLLSYTVRYSVFSSVSINTGQFSNLIVFGVVCLVQFAYHYGVNHHPRESRFVLIVSAAAAFTVWGSLFVTPNLETVYDFRAEYFAYEFGPRVSFLVLIGYFWSIVVLLRKVLRSSKQELKRVNPGIFNRLFSAFRCIARPAGRVAFSARSFALLTLATTVIALTYMLFQTGVITRGTYALVFNTGSLLVCLLIFVVYINNSPQPTSYLTKLIGIPLAVIMVAFGITASALMPVVRGSLADSYRREIDQAQMSIQDQNLTGLPSGIAFILPTSSSPATLRFSSRELSDTAILRLGSEPGSKGLLPQRRGLAPRFLYLDLHDTDSFYLYYTITDRGVSYRVGLPYTEYRVAIHRFCSKIALIVLITSVLVVLGFPVAFRRGLLKPLRILLEAVQQVSSGNYRMFVSVPSQDEVGQLARGYNQMVSYLRAAEGNFKALAENANDAILILSHAGQVLYANLHSTEISGYSPVDLRRMHFRDFVHPDELAAVTRRFSERMAGRDAPRCYETRIVSRHGKVIPVEITGARTTWHNEAADVVIIRDISERKEAEERLQVQQQQLLRMDKLASLGALVAGVAHEVNNPNQVIGMNSRFLLDGLPHLFALADSAEETDEDIRVSGMSYEEFKEASRSAISEIEGSTTRINHIVSELKRFVRGGTKGKRESTDLNQVIRTVVDLSRHMIAKATDCFDLALQSNLPTVPADRIGMEQVIMNLLLNACQALPDRQRQVRISTRCDTVAEALCIEVEDQGVGISPDSLARLTDPFFTTRGEKGGTGLGLSVSQRIVRDHGGTIRFQSVVGQGTTVTVTIPAEASRD